MEKKITEYQFFKELTQLPYVEEIWVYGSRARNDHSERSDIDLAILCPKADRQDWMYIMDIIDNADTLLKIDCLQFDKNLISNTLYKNILKDKKILYVKK